MTWNVARSETRWQGKYVGDSVLPELGCRLLNALWAAATGVLAHRANNLLTIQPNGKRMGKELGGPWGFFPQQLPPPRLESWLC